MKAKNTNGAITVVDKLKFRGKPWKKLAEIFHMDPNLYSLKKFSERTANKFYHIKGVNLETPYQFLKSRIYSH